MTMAESTKKNKSLTPKMSINEIKEKFKEDLTNEGFRVVEFMGTILATRSIFTNEETEIAKLDSIERVVLTCSYDSRYCKET